jgi:hypothetical protein
VGVRVVNTRGRRRLSWVGAGFVVWLACGLVGAGAAAADTATFTTQGCGQLWTVPAGVSSLTISATGAGGAGGGAAASGGQGRQVSETVGISHGQTVDVCVNHGGAAGGSGSGSNGQGSAGGGASGVSLGSDFGSPLLIAPGGGGGGGNGSFGGGPGGAADANGTPGTGPGGGTFGSAGGGSGSLPSGPGTGASGANASSGGGGGGGGGGFHGGGGGAGAASLSGGGGGGGGTDFCSTSCSSAAASTGTQPQVTLTYTVASAPTTSITTPANGATYQQNRALASNFSCTDGANGSGISSCIDQNGHNTGTALDTSTIGSHTFTVAATSSDGLSSSSTVTYNVAGAPAIWLPQPQNGAVYTLGQAASSYFLCADGSGGPGLASCVDQSGHAAGGPIDTSAVGTHTFTVTATSADGLTTSVSNTYTVIPRPTVSNVKARHGVVTFNIGLAAPGNVDAVDTTTFRSFALAADGLQPPLGSFVFGRADVVSTQAGTMLVTVKLTAVGKLLLRDHRRATLQLVVNYTGSAGVAQTILIQTVRVTR